MQRGLKVALVVALATALVLGVTLPVLAASDETTAETECKWFPRLLRGEVIDVDQGEEYFTIEVGEREVEIDVNDDTRYFELNIPQKLATLCRNRIRLTQQEGQEEIDMTAVLPMPMNLRAVDRAPLVARGLAFRNLARVRIENQELAPDLPPADLGEEGSKYLPRCPWLRNFGEEVTFDDLTDGDRVVVWAVPDNDRPLAKLVLIVEPLVYGRVSGAIYTEDDTITVESAEGDTELHYDDRTVFVLHGTPYFVDGMEGVVIYVEENGVPLAKRVMVGVELPEPAE
jgi:hypothetical protein